jgi:hypothetical protein
LPKERRYGRIVGAATIAVLLGVSYLILFSSTVYESPEFLPVITWIAVALLIVAIFSRKLNKIEVSSDEKVFVFAYEASELREYPLPIDITNAASDLDCIIGELELNWTLEFKLAKEALSSVTDLLLNLRLKLLRALAKGQTTDVKLSVWTLAKLCRLLVSDHPKVSQVEEINSRIWKLPEWKLVEKVKFHVRCDFG